MEVEMKYLLILPPPPIIPLFLLIERKEEKEVQFPYPGLCTKELRVMSNF